MLLIRQMRPEDAAEKGYVHWKSWQETYPGLVDSNYLANMTLAEQQQRALLHAAFTLVAELDGHIVGFVKYGPCRDEDLAGCGEVYSIYVLRGAQHIGIGRRLMDAAMQKLQQYSTIAIWVLRGNTNASNFYTHYGFRFDGAKKDITIGGPNQELRMIFHRH